MANVEFVHAIQLSPQSEHYGFAPEIQINVESNQHRLGKKVCIKSEVVIGESGYINDNLQQHSPAIHGGKWKNHNKALDIK